MRINEEAVEKSTDKINESLSRYILDDIKRKDSISTISANKNSKDAFIHMKEIVDLFDSTLKNDLKNAIELYISLDKMDNKLKKQYIK